MKFSKIRHSPFSLGALPFRQIVFATILVGASAVIAANPVIIHDPAGKVVSFGDSQSNLVLRLNYAERCVLDQVIVRGRQVIAPETGVCTGIKTGDKWFTTRSGISSPKVVTSKDSVTVSGILLDCGGFDATETWRFSIKPGRIQWRIDRSYPKTGTVDEVALPEWNFKDMSIWTGGLLGNGGVIWNRYIETPNATFSTRTDSVTFWNRNETGCLRISANTSDARQIAARFSHQPNNAFSFNCIVNEAELQPKHDLRRFLHDRQDVWKPFAVSAGETSVELTLQGLDYDAAYCRGATPGVNERSIREVLNTIARYGVIDRGLLGGNGWRTGWVCLHEQWFAQFGLAIDDPGYTRMFADVLDYERDHAILPDGRVKSRWHHTPDDAQPGTYDALGFYEATWGTLLDSQPCYVICVAEEFDLTGDQRWLQGQKAACERALEYLLRRDSDNDGLVEMMTDSHTQQKGSDWIDVIWASHENALVNAELYYAMQLWANLEDLLGDATHADSYRSAAAKLKSAFNKTIAEGGFWDPQNQWYVYWRDKDDSIHGNNLVTPVNFSAIGYGLCDDPARQHAIRDRIEAEMQKEKLFFWPLSFFPYQPDEGHPKVNYPFPAYENGDIFLSWGELGIRCYANENPALAMKYIKSVLAHYEKDGLSFQRYLRQSQQGAGDDILAGNCSAVVGLYRDIYGIQPRHNRLYLEPHLTPELNGTSVTYVLRGQRYTVDLSVGDYRASVGGTTVRSRTPFGINGSGDRLEFFPGANSVRAMMLKCNAGKTFEASFESWPEDFRAARRWTESASERCAVEHTIEALEPGAVYKIVAATKAVSRRADKNGRIQFSTALRKNEPVVIEVTK